MNTWIILAPPPILTWKFPHQQWETTSICLIVHMDSNVRMLNLYAHGKQLQPLEFLLPLVLWDSVHFQSYTGQISPFLS